MNRLKRLTFFLFTTMKFSNIMSNKEAALLHVRTREVYLPTTGVCNHIIFKHYNFVKLEGVNGHLHWADGGNPFSMHPYSRLQSEYRSLCRR